MTQKTLHKAKLVYYTLEHLLGPVLVFVTCYLHHLYFADDFVSSFFAGFALISLLMVMALERVGLLISSALQLAFLAWVAIAGPQELLQQLLFTASLAISLIATYINLEPKVKEEPQVVAHPLPAQPEKKEKLWQELYDARQEIKSLYQEKQELADKCQLLQHHLEAEKEEKADIAEQRQAAEEDIKKLIDNMHEMALRNAPKEEEPPAKKTTHEAMYLQLKKQFEEKSQTLDETRKKLFLCQEEITCLQSTLNEPRGHTDEEKELLVQLEALEHRLEAQKKKHHDELIGYEEVIQGLLAQLQEKK